MPDRDRRNDRDDLDTWLQDRIDPLPPPPGTFEAIRRRARRRKYRKLAVSVGAAAVIVAAAATVPQVVNLPIQRGSQVAGQAPEHTQGNNATPTGSSGVEASATATIPALPSGNAVPPNFQPSSVTAVSTTRMFTIGQAGTPGQCATAYCTSVARTEDGGTTWNGLPAPLTGAPDGATGVGQIRFLEGINGWAFGPELWATHDGGEQWHEIATHGQRVIDVETVGERAFAIEATCTGTGSAFASDCTSFTLYSSPAKANDWSAVGAATTDLTTQAGGPSNGAAALVLTGERGYLLGPDGTLYAGPVTGEAWQSVGNIPCGTGQPQADGEPSGALLGAVTATSLLVACTQSPNGDSQTKLIYSSANGGRSWQPYSTPPAAGIATSIAASVAGTLVLGTSSGIEVLPPGSNSTWQQASLTGSAPATGFSYVGMTTASKGMALPADPANGAIWITTDGGVTWSASAVK
jgi:hypothetical protein